MSFEVCEKRFSVIKKDEISMFEDGSSEAATFSHPRWAHFVEYFDEFDNALDKLLKEDDEVKLRLHIGASWYLSVTSGYRCVDIRKFYLAQDGVIRPTKIGTALWIFEWNRMKEIVKEIKDKLPMVADTQSC